MRNPYAPQQITKYLLTEDVVDIICFGTKNPEPMLKYLPELSTYKQFWSITITPYEKDIEPFVPPKDHVISYFKTISKNLGESCVSWRYDPIFLSDKYSFDFHLSSFSRMCKELSGYTDNCIISFIDLYEKTKRNFPNINEVSKKDQIKFVHEFVRIASNHNIAVKTCCENSSLAEYGADISGCINQSVLERACGFELSIPSPKKLMTRESCRCLIGNDIGAYNTCGHGCLYCYANYDMKTVKDNMSKHDPNSPLLIGNILSEDHINEPKQEKYANMQLKWF